MNTVSNYELVRINNKSYYLSTLNAYYSPKIKALVEEYILDQNCWPALWATDLNLDHVDTACFIYHCLNHTNYTIK